MTSAKKHIDEPSIMPGKATDGNDLPRGHDVRKTFDRLPNAPRHRGGTMGSGMTESRDDSTYRVDNGHQQSDR